MTFTKKTADVFISIIEIPPLSCLLPFSCVAKSPKKSCHKNSTEITDAETIRVAKTVRAFTCELELCSKTWWILCNTEVARLQPEYGSRHFFLSAGRSIHQQNRPQHVNRSLLKTEDAALIIETNMLTNFWLNMWTRDNGIPALDTIFIWSWINGVVM